MDDAEARAILREHGEEPPRRGTLGQSWRDRAADLAAHGPNGDRPADLAGDYDQGVSEADFDSVSAAADPPPPVPNVPADVPAAAAGTTAAEQPPRRVKRPPRKPLAERVREAATGKAKAKGKGKKQHARVRVDRLISHGWNVLGGLAARVDPPVGRCLQMQSPVAGLILEDVVKGTFVDRALQPIARGEEKAEKIAALVAPPLLVAGLEMAQQLPDPQRKAREAILFPLLVESLVLSERVAGPYADQVIERATEDEPARERAAQLINAIFATPTVAADTPQPETAGV
jgi:hypothetical protein